MITKLFSWSLGLCSNSSPVLSGLLFARNTRATHLVSSNARSTYFPCLRLGTVSNTRKIVASCSAVTCSGPELAPSVRTLPNITIAAISLLSIYSRGAYTYFSAPNIMKNSLLMFETFFCPFLLLRKIMASKSCKEKRSEHYADILPNIAEHYSCFPSYQLTINHLHKHRFSQKHKIAQKSQRNYCSPTPYKNNNITHLLPDSFAPSSA
jgi:hypothetical protein